MTFTLNVWTLLLWPWMWVKVIRKITTGDLDWLRSRSFYLFFLFSTDKDQRRSEFSVIQMTLEVCACVFPFQWREELWRERTRLSCDIFRLPWTISPQTKTSLAAILWKGIHLWWYTHVHMAFRDSVSRHGRQLCLFYTWTIQSYVPLKSVATFYLANCCHYLYFGSDHWHRDADGEIMQCVRCNETCKVLKFKAFLIPASVLHGFVYTMFLHCNEYTSTMWCH